MCEECFDDSPERNRSKVNSPEENSLNESFLNPDDDDEQLANKITKLAGMINAANYRFLKLIAEFDRREAWAGAGIRSCAHWLNWKCGIATGAARERVRVARALDGLPEINVAFEKGEVSYSKVRAMTRVATEDNESFLIMIAEHGTAHHMEKLVQKYQRVCRGPDFEKEDLDIDQQEHRELIYYKDIDGMWVVHAKLPAEEGGLLAKTLDAIADRFSSAARSKKEASGKPDAESQIKSDTPQNETVGVSAETSATDNPTGGDTASCGFECNHIKEKESSTMEQYRADALAALAEHYLAGSQDTGKGAEGAIDAKPALLSLKGAERCQLILHVRSETYPPKSGHVNGHSTDHTNCDLDGHWLPPDAAKKLACDASLLVVEEDEVGNVLDIGRRSRIIPPAISRALSIRDGGCQFPGCCNSRYVEGHHVTHWADGGETKLENLVTLCGFHHIGLHRGDFSLTLLPATQHVQRFADRLVFTRGDNGEIIEPDGCEFSPDDTDVSVFESSLPTAIDEQTAVTKWEGERMDMGMAIDGLLYPYRRNWE